MRYLILSCLLTVSTVVLGDAKDDRITTLEAQVATLKKQLAAAQPPITASGAPRIPIVVTRKRLNAENIEKRVEWSESYSGEHLSRDARSIKGVLVFADLFKEPQLRVSVTIDKPLEVDGTLTRSRVGIRYNQFFAEHQWMVVTDLEDMTYWFEVTAILFKDGTLVEYD